MTRFLITTGLALALTLPAIAAAPLDTTLATLKTVPREHRIDGTVEAVNEATISAQTSGQVESVLVDVDDYVEKGTVLLTIKDTEHQANLARAEAQLDAASARYQDAVKEQRRLKALFEQNAISKADMDKVDAKLDAARADRDAAQAAHKQALEQLEYTQVRAPYTGIVKQRHVDPGEAVQPGTPLMTGNSLSELRVTVDVPQNLIAPVRKYAQAKVLLPDGTWLAAEKFTVFPFAEERAKTFRVRLYLPEGAENLFPGMFVKVAFVTGSQQVVTVPNRSVVYRSEVTGVYVVGDDDTVRFRMIRLGNSVDAWDISVLAGLDAEERVALDPISAGTELKAQHQQQHDK